MARDPNRSSAGDLGRGERWDRERFSYERGRDRYGDERIRYEEDDQVYTRDSRGPPPRPGPARRDGRPFEEEYVRDRRYYEDDYSRRPSSPPATEFQRKVVIQKERTRSPSPPPRRPGTLLRRQSSLDTFDRRPPTRFYEREEYEPPARREDFRPPPNVPIPLPRTRGLPPPRRYGERAYEEVRVSDSDRYGDDDFRPYPERVREREIIRTRRRDRSRESRSTHTHSHRGSTVRSSSRSSSTSSSSSSSSGGTTVKSEYPKKGKTRIPGRLVSKRALIDLGYPFIEEGSTVVVQKALGQEQIDDLLKLSENYKKSELEMSGARPAPATEVIEERREEVYIAPGGPRPHATAFPPPPPPVLHTARPAPVEVVNTTTLIRDVSPARSTTTTSSYGPVVVDARPREYSEEVAVGPLALVTQDHHHHHHHHRHRSHSRGDRVLRAEVRDVERRGWSGGEVVAAERLSNGELVLYEEKIERIEEPRRGVRIEKDKKGPPPGLVRAMLATLT